MALIEIGTLFSSLTAEEVLDTLLDAAEDAGLPVTAWQRLSPSRTILASLANLFADWTTLVGLVGRGGLLDYAQDGWLDLLGSNVYNVTRIPAAAATGTVKMTNSGASTYVISAAGQVTVENSSTGATYRNTTTGTLNPSSTLELEFIADEVGTDSNAAVSEIDTLVTPTLLNVTIDNDVDAFVGTSLETDADYRERCRDSLGALSPNGAAQAYEYVALTTARADGSIVDINRVHVTGSSSTGQVTVTIASSSGAPVAGDVTLVDTAIQDTVVPVTVTCTVQAATALSIDVTYEAFVPDDADETSADIQTAIQTALTNHFASLPIGGQKTSGGGTKYVWVDDIRAAIHNASDAIFSVTLSAPAADTAVSSTQVPTLGTITPTITRVVQS